MTEGLKEVANGDEAPGQSGVSSALATAWSTSVTDITWLLQPHLMSAPLREGQTSKSKATKTECRQQDFGSLGGFGPLSRQQHLTRLLFSSSSRCGQIKSIRTKPLWSLERLRIASSKICSETSTSSSYTALMVNEEITGELLPVFHPII